MPKDNGGESFYVDMGGSSKPLAKPPRYLIQIALRSNSDNDKQLASYHLQSRQDPLFERNLLVLQEAIRFQGGIENRFTNYFDVLVELS